MAKNTVKVDVKVDDKGSTKKVELGAKKASKSLDGAGKSARTVNRNIKGAAQTAAASGKNFSKMSQGMGGLVAGYATLAAQIFAISAAFNFLKSAGDLTSLKAGQQAYAAATGVAMRTLTNDIIAATGAQVSFQDAASAGAIGIAAGLNADQLTRLGTAAKDASIILGRDVTDSFNRLIRGVTKAEPELLDELGIILRLDDASEKYGRTIGVLGKDLTQFQKTQAVTADVLQQSEEKYSRIIAIVDPGVNKFNQLGKAFDDIVNNLKDVAVNLATPLADLFIKFPQIAYAGFLLIGKGILTATIPALQNFSERTAASAEKSRNAWEEAKQELEEYNIALGNAAKNPEQTAKRGKEARSTAKKLYESQGTDAKKQKARKGSGLAILESGQLEKLTEKQAKAMKKSALEGSTAYQHMSTKMRKDFAKAMDAIILAHNVAAGQITATTVRSTFNWRGKWLASIAAVKGAMSAFATFAQRAGALISKAFFWIQAAALAAGTLKLAYDALFKLTPVVDETTHKLTILGERVSSLAGEYEHFAKVQKIMLEDAANAEAFWLNLGQLVGSVSTDQINMIGVQLNDAIGATFQQNIKESTAALEEFQARIDKYNNLVIADNTYNIWGVKFESGALAMLESYTRALLSDLIPALASVQEKNAELIKSTEEAKNMNAFEVVIASSATTDAQKDSARYLLQQAEAYDIVRAKLKELGQTSSKAFDAYGNLLNEMKASNSVDPADLARAKAGVDELTQALSESASLAKSNKTAVTDFVRAFAGVSKESALLDKLQDQLNVLAVTMKDGAGDNDKNKKLLEDTKSNYSLVADILAAQYDTKLRMSKLDIESIKALRGATKGQKARLKIDIALLKNQIKAAELRSKIKTAEDVARTDGNRGLRADELLSIRVNEDKLETLREQSTELERQNDFTVQLTDDIKNSFESGFSSGLSDIITGKETSLRDSIAKLATSILESVADVIAKNITDTVVDIIFKKPEISEAEIMDAALTNHPIALADALALAATKADAAEISLASSIVTAHKSAATSVAAGYKAGAEAVAAAAAAGEKEAAAARKVETETLATSAASTLGKSLEGGANVIAIAIQDVANSFVTSLNSVVTSMGTAIDRLNSGETFQEVLDPNNIVGDLGKTVKDVGGFVKNVVDTRNEKGSLAEDSNIVKGFAWLTGWDDIGKRWDDADPNAKPEPLPSVAAVQAMLEDTGKALKEAQENLSSFGPAGGEIPSLSRNSAEGIDAENRVKAAEKDFEAAFAIKMRLLDTEKGIEGFSALKAAKAAAADAAATDAAAANAAAVAQTNVRLNQLSEGGEGHANALAQLNNTVIDAVQNPPVAPKEDGVGELAATQEALRLCQEGALKDTANVVTKAGSAISNGGENLQKGIESASHVGAAAIGEAITSACKEVAVAEGTSMGTPPLRPNKFIDGFEGKGGTDGNAFIKAFGNKEEPPRLSPLDPNKEPEGDDAPLKMEPSNKLMSLFSDFTQDLGGLFSKDTPFLEGLGTLFTNLKGNLGSIFGSLLNGLGGLFSRLFGGGGGKQSTASSIFSMFLSSAVSAGVGALKGAFSNPSISASQQSTLSATNANMASKLPNIEGRYGGVMSEGSKVPGYATGGVARGAQAGYPATLHGTEAIVPLPNGRSIPVEMQGTNQNNNVSVNIAIDQNGNSKQDSQADGKQGADLGVAIAAAVQKELHNQKRSGGILSPYGVG